MTISVTVTQIGNSCGIILPKELLAQLRLSKGDKLYLTEIPDGFAARPFNEDFAHTMEVAEKIMREDRDVLRKLAQ